MTTPVVSLGSVYVNGPFGFNSSGAIRQGRAVKFTANVNEVEECDSAGEAAYGVSLQLTADGEGVSVLRGGRFDLAEAGAAMATPNVPVACDSQGRYVAAVEGDVILGWNRTAAAGAGSFFLLELDGSGQIAPST
jgi:hypothetical protein